jgi:hypothetical protein
MNLKETLLKEHSKANCMRIVKWVGDDQEKFYELFDLFLNAEYRVVQRAAWPVSYCVEFCFRYISAPSLAAAVNNYDLCSSAPFFLLFKLPKD